jgi:nucleoside-diphosphate-sugar epimerase
MNLTDHLLDRFDQIIVYGAKGWFGRSAIHALTEENQEIHEHQVLLVGSRSETAGTSSPPLNVYSTSEATQYIKSNILFVNSAYLRREKLNFMSEKEYEDKNREIIEFGTRLVQGGKVKTFLNLSSGVASQGNNLILGEVADPYARCKIRDENLLTSICASARTDLINARIYSMSGRYLNEFENLALSSFINQANNLDREIMVNSPPTLRSYVDSIDLAKVLLKLAFVGGSHSLDSGGTITTLGNLASCVATAIPGASVNLQKEFEKSPDYYCENSHFNELAVQLGVELKDLGSQIMETLKAFTEK